MQNLLTSIIFPPQANSSEHVDALCRLGTTLYNLLPCGAVNTISGNLGLQIFKNVLLGANHGGTSPDSLQSPNVHGNLVENFSGVRLPNSADSFIGAFEKLCHHREWKSEKYNFGNTQLRLLIYTRFTVYIDFGSQFWRELYICNN